ncbi:MAG: ABC transporter substrate-binding protein [Syntrophaceticus sp.]|nr:ABC transporter substrate-binding protein [Syntrophaceticus sp.]MDD3074710.1 ABC transporter substrate-binding protein [Eubacteriales bacterium]MDD4783770.1 ABC transporter substrate-binding protein [Syntrophaceticus sp.]
MKNRFMIIVVCVLSLSLLLLGGCEQQQKNAEQVQNVTVVLDWTPNTNHTGVYVAQKMGYYEEEGLEVEITQPGEGTATQLIAADQGDFGFSYQEDMTIARTQGLPVKALAAVIQHNTSGFASPEEKGIENPEDFEGKKYGGWGSPAEEAMLKALMAKADAGFDKVEMINIGTADFFASVEKDVDFAWIYWGWTGVESEIRDVPLNFIQLRDYHDALDFYSPILIASEQTLEERPELVEKFMKATARGYQYCIDNPEQAGEILCESVPELNKDLVIKSQEYLADEYQSDASRWGEMSEERWEKYANWMYSQELIETPLEANDAFTNDFLPEE